MKIINKRKEKIRKNLYERTYLGVSNPFLIIYIIFLLHAIKKFMINF